MNDTYRDTTNAVKLDKELITDPHLWRLSLEIKPHAIEIVIQSAIIEHSLIHRRIDIDTEDDRGILSQLESAVYDNPLLLCDFGKTDILIATNRFTIVPETIGDDDVRRDMMNVLWPGNGYSIVANDLASSGNTLLMSVETPLLAFVRRTFPAATIQHRLVPIITYFYNKDRLNNASKLYINLRPKSMDAIYCCNGRIKAVNTYEAPTLHDRLYYIMLAAQTSDFNLKEDELMLCGQPSLREELSPILRKYINYVMPVVFPSAVYHAGKDAMESPFELIILPLCE